MSLAHVIKSVLATTLVVSAVAGTGCASAVDPDPADGQAATQQAPEKLTVGADPINCNAGDGAGNYVCFMKYYAPLMGDYLLLDNLSADDDDQVFVENIGQVSAIVYVNQFAKNGAQWTELTPGQSVTLHRVDGWWSWFGVRAQPSTNVDPSQVQLQVRVNYTTPNGPRAKCFDECFLQFQGCMQGCGELGVGTGCQVGCEGGVKVCREGCINRYPPAPSTGCYFHR